MSHSRVIAAAAATALFCLAVPAEAGCSKSVIMYNASWCPYCRQVRAILARNHIRYSILDATTPQVQAVMLKRFGDTAVPRTISAASLSRAWTRRGSGSSAAKDLPSKSDGEKASGNVAVNIAAAAQWRGGQLGGVPRRGLRLFCVREGLTTVRIYLADITAARTVSVLLTNIE